MPAQQELPHIQEEEIGEQSQLLDQSSSLSHKNHSEQQLKSPVHRTPTDKDTMSNEDSHHDSPPLTILQMVKYTYSLILLGFCIMLILSGIFARETPLAQASHPFVAFGVMWVLILWLGILEGGQGSLVGLQPIDKTLYERSHPLAYQCTKMAHEGDNLNRFIVGRQFLVCIVVFGISLCCSVVDGPHPPLEGYPTYLVQCLFESGIGVLILTVILGQLSAEVNATRSMLDFINTPIMLATTWICLIIEESGVLHSVYLIQSFFPKQESAGDNKSNTQQGWSYWIRVVFSLILLVGSLVVTLDAMVHYQTTMYAGVSNMASLALFVFLVFFLGMLEAMQIALFAVVNLPEKVLQNGPRTAQTNCALAFEGNNFQAFLIGRQICVTMTMFLLARITTTNVRPPPPPGPDGGDMEVMEDLLEGTLMSALPELLRDFFNTGLPGALITTIVASLWWRIIAASYPIAFMANPLVYVTIQLCLLLEASGVFSAAWILADALKSAVGLRNDSEFLDTGSETDVESGRSYSFSDSDDEESVAVPSKAKMSTRSASDDSTALLSLDSSSDMSAYGTTSL